MRRFSGTTRNALLLGLPAALLGAGLVAGQLRSADWSWRSPVLAEVDRLSELEPIRALPRTEAVLATLEARRYLSASRPYAAWLALRDHVGGEGPAGTAATLLAAEAAAGWGGWSEVRSILGDRSGLESMGDAEGLFYLARANEELGSPNTATEQYRRYLAVPRATMRGEAATRLGGILAERGEHGEAALAYAQAAELLPEVADWLQVLHVGELVAAGDPSATSVATRMLGGAPPARMRRVQLEAEGWQTEARSSHAIERLEWESRVLSASGAPDEAASLRIKEAELQFEMGRPMEARNVLGFVAGDRTVSSGVRLRAARRLDEEADLAPAELIPLADAYQAAGEPGLAARSLRLAIERGLNPTPDQRLRLARLLYDERDYSEARTQFVRAAGALTDPTLEADARLFAARSLFRAGGSSAAQRRNRAEAMDEFADVIRRWPETPAAGTAHFLLGDEASTVEAGLRHYAQAAEIQASPEAREALDRVGDRNLRTGNQSAAIRAWTTYTERYPRGDETARIAYEVGRIHEAAGRRNEARAMYQKAIDAEPTAYYAMRAAERGELDVLAPILADARPWPGLASEPGEAAEVLKRIDRLDQLGLTAEAAAEIDYATRTFQGKSVALLTLAEGIRDRGRPVEAIRIGRTLRESRGGEWDERLLKLNFPLLYRDIIVAEAKRSDVEPALYAGLVRQESTFRASVKSWVGATGLGQIMPSTGQWLASSLRIPNYEQSMLEVPEINVRMGAYYFGDLLDRYDGAADLALAGYNAGPSRADRWKRTLGYGRDVDTFRDAIPFDETRNYVKVVLRNASIYRELYGTELE